MNYFDGVWLLFCHLVKLSFNLIVTRRWYWLFNTFRHKILIEFVRWMNFCCVIWCFFFAALHNTLNKFFVIDNNIMMSTKWFCTHTIFVPFLSINQSIYLLRFFVFRFSVLFSLSLFFSRSRFFFSSCVRFFLVF